MGDVNVEIQKPISDKEVAVTSFTLRQTAVVGMRKIFGKDAPNLWFDHDNSGGESLHLQGDFEIIEGENRIKVRDYLVTPSQPVNFSLSSPDEKTVYHIHINHKK